MRAFVLLSLLFVSASAGAQTAPIPSPGTQVVQPAAGWDPASSYITAGQDEPGYRSWYIAAPFRAAQVKSFNDYLVDAKVGGIVPTWELFRTATSWKDCGGQPFEVPPTVEWPNIVQTLRYIRDYVVPAVGPVEPVSVYRNPNLNVCAGGAPESAHKNYSAIDMRSTESKSSCPSRARSVSPSSSPSRRTSSRSALCGSSSGTDAVML